MSNLAYYIVSLYYNLSISLLESCSKANIIEDIREYKVKRFYNSRSTAYTTTNSDTFTLELSIANIYFAL